MFLDRSRLDLRRESGEFPIAMRNLDDTATTVYEGIAEEAVRLAQTSGRTQREIAGDLGIGLSTLVRWVGRSRDQQAGCRSIGSSERCHGGAEAAAAGERDPSAGTAHPEEGHSFFRPGGKSMSL